MCWRVVVSWCISLSLGRMGGLPPRVVNAGRGRNSAGRVVACGRPPVLGRVVVWMPTPPAVDHPLPGRAAIGDHEQVPRLRDREAEEMQAAQRMFRSARASLVRRGRLYDRKLVVSRVLVYGMLASIVTFGYIGVLGVGRLAGLEGSWRTTLALLTTAVVAVAYQPLRRRLQLEADGVICGRRVTPHEVLADVSLRVSANDNDLLGSVAKSLVDGTSATHVEIWLEDGGRRIEAARWPLDTSCESATTATRPITHDGTHLGSLVLGAPNGQPLTFQDELLVLQVASGIGLALRNRRLTVTLEHRVGELRESRCRLVALQDAIRRRLERDLHDGVQQQLVALRVKLGVAQAMAERNHLVRSAEAVAALSADVDCVVDTVRTFATGVYPPLLEAEGLAGSIPAEADRCPWPVAVHIEGVGRYDRVVEATVNLCVAETLRHVRAHGNVHQAMVTLTEQDERVCFEIRDDGDSVDPCPPGHGLGDLVDRIDSLTGTLTVTLGPRGGTVVAGAIPIDGGEE